jgi:hypothetical protein
VLVAPGTGLRAMEEVKRTFDYLLSDDAWLEGCR